MTTIALIDDEGNQGRGGPDGAIYRKRCTIIMGMEGHVVAGKKSFITPELIDQMCDYVRRGTWDWVAAELVGVPVSTFRRWMTWGEAHYIAEDEGIPYEDAVKRLVPTIAIPTKDRELFRAVWGGVRKARAEARSRAEIAVVQMEPYKWLRHGPGRDMPGEPGWSEQQIVTGPGSAAVQLEVKPMDYRDAIKPLAPED